MGEYIQVKINAPEFDAYSSHRVSRRPAESPHKKEKTSQLWLISHYYLQLMWVLHTISNLDWVNVTITCYYTGFGGCSAHRPLLQPDRIDHRNRFAPKLVRRDNCLLHFWLPVLDYATSAVFFLFATLYKNKILTKPYNILCHNIQ